MTATVKSAVNGDHIAPLPEAFRAAMRHLAGAVSVITVGQGDDRSGLTATSVLSLALTPPTVLVCVNREASSWPLLARYGHFGINVLAASQQAIADRFAGRGGSTGTERYRNADWVRLETGAPILADALVAIDCELEELIDRHSHSIVLGRVKAVRVSETSDALLYWRGGYGVFQPGVAPLDRLK
jgi:flavin reductase (DIM6/NTAB) family NADH-FMN oxidoreductase RutF